MAHITKGHNRELSPHDMREGSPPAAPVHHHLDRYNFVEIWPCSSPKRRTPGAPGGFKKSKAQSRKSKVQSRKSKVKNNRESQQGGGGRLGTLDFGPGT